MNELRCIIMGAAGRDFHDFRTFFRDRPEFRVVAFTAEQIPFIDERSFPCELAGPRYDEDIPIHHAAELEELIATHRVDFVFLAFSDVSHEEVMHRASRVHAAGASFALLGPRHTELRSTRPVIAVTAVRTGAGKSPLSLWLAQRLVEHGVSVGIVRHPMPYGDLRAQAVQRFATSDDLRAQDCTVEEREEYQPYVEAGLTIWAGVDYEAILHRAEEAHDVILWDGGNNDRPFFAADLAIVVADAKRPGHEVRFHPGETNLRRADVIVINKVAGAAPGAVEEVHRHAAALAPTASVVEADLEVSVDAPSAIAGKRVLVVEDGPTTTHGGMPSGAGLVAAREHGAGTIVDPRPFAVGTIAAAYRDFPHLGPVVPALGYSEAQRGELLATIERANPDTVVDASPARLDLALDLAMPLVRARYRFVQRGGPSLAALVAAFLRSKGLA